MKGISIATIQNFCGRESTGTRSNKNSKESFYLFFISIMELFETEYRQENEKFISISPCYKNR